MTLRSDDDTVLPMKHVGILGSTGSIGSQAIAVLRQFPERFRVPALAAGSNIHRLVEQIREFAPEVVAVSTPERREELKARLKEQNPPFMPEILAGSEGLVSLATWPGLDTLVIGVVGFIGLLPTLKALECGKRVLTANKETFVAAGHLVEPSLSQIIPLDSEHSAIFQCLQGTLNRDKEVKKLYLTASGGPFREWTASQLQHVTVEEALNHPNWSMGEKVTVDSATMMNKGLELIEAHHLFGLPLERIEIVVHPQSIIHSAVAFVDGSILAQMGQPDMRVPLQYGLTCPERWPMPFADAHLDLAQLGSLQFSQADPERFPCLQLARWAAETGGTMPVVLNAADEVAVNAFLQKALPFHEIPRFIETIMQQHLPEWEPCPDLERIVHWDAQTRAAGREILTMPRV